ncbi:MAG: lysoplasmalogenase [Pikeienuella sp.]
MTLVLISSVVCSCFYGFVYLRDPPSLIRTILKTLPIALLAVYAFYSDSSWLLIAALAFCALGDAALSRDGEAAFMAGLGSFLIGHIFYIIVLLYLSDISPDLSPMRLLGCVGALIYAVVVARWMWPHLAEMKLPVTVYMIAILLMGAAAITAPTYYWPAMVGAALFIASDSVLAGETFVWKDRVPKWAPLFIWVTYYFGQALIALTALEGIRSFA